MTAVPDWYTQDVSRETLDRLTSYADLLAKWTRKINLIAPSTVDQIMERHVWDSAQVYEGQQSRWVDMGSGGGLPAVVVAILRQGDGIMDPIGLIESDQRKCTFLRACARELGLNLEISAQRVEKADPWNADIVSARALAPLSDLLGHAQRHLMPRGHCIFMKGANWRKEIDVAQQSWRFSYDAKPSMTEPEAAILDIRDIERV